MAKHSKPSKWNQIRTYWNTDKAAPSKVTSRAKFRAHLVCITIGIALAIGATYVGGIAVHFAVVVPVLPSIVQEAIDRIFNF